MSVRYITFEKVLRGGGNQLYLHFPGKNAPHCGPFPDRDTAWEMYVRIAREIYFWFEPNEPILDETP